jgi:hypothetical protein
MGMPMHIKKYLAAGLVQESRIANPAGLAGGPPASGVAPAHRRP